MLGGVLCVRCCCSLVLIFDVLLFVVWWECWYW